MGRFVPLYGKYPPTKKIFHRDPYLTEIDTTVAGVHANYVVLSDTIFYAESGGQDADRGTIEHCEVVDVSDQQGTPFYGKNTLVKVPPVNIDTIVVHHVDGTSDLTAGQTVRLKIDWRRRYKLMRNHSAAHFLYYATRSIVEHSLGRTPDISGCHISVSGVRFDFMDDIPFKLITDIENLANTLIAMGEEIRMLSEPSSDEIFYWIYRDIIIPCGGTHVKSAEELGPIKVTRKKQGRNRTRLAFQGVCGEHFGS